MSASNKESHIYASDLSDIYSLIEVKSQLEKYKKLSFVLDGKNCEKFMIVHSNSERRITEKTKVGFRYQVCLYNKKNESFEIVEKMYKNMIKKKINEMSKDDFLLRKCLLEMSQGDHIFFSIPLAEETSELFARFKAKLLSAKKNEFKKEYKEDLIFKLKEERRKKEKSGEKSEEKEGENVPPPNYNVPEEEMKKVEERFEFEERIYYRIFVEEITRDRPAFPGNFKDVTNYIKCFNTEIKELISRNEINNALAWCNEAIQKVLHMNKKKAEELSQKKNERFKKEIYAEIKKIILNKTFLLDKNINVDARKNCEDAIKLIEAEFYGRELAKVVDENYMKVTGRYIRFCADIKEFGKVETGFNLYFLGKQLIYVLLIINYFLKIVVVLRAAKMNYFVQIFNVQLIFFDLVIILIAQCSV